MYNPVAAPVHMAWLATNLCNARCLHCSSNSARPALDELTTCEAYRMLDDLSDAGVIDLAISGGEPLLRNDIFEVIEHAKRRGFTVGIGTNGTTVTDETLVRLRELGINRLQVSLDGFSSAHDSLRRWPGLFDRATKAISQSVSSGIRTHVCCTINRKNFTSLVDLAQLVMQMGVKRLNFSRFIPTGRGDDSLDLTVTEWKDVVTAVNDLRFRLVGQLDVVSHLAQQVLVDDRAADVEVFNGCQAGIGQGCISYEGTIFPCVLLPVPVGNIRRHSFAEVWRSSPVIQALRSRSGLKGKCSSCAWKPGCGGCRAVAYAKKGDFLASDPRCWL
jgi:AdoMet-dependent heme synthase